MRIRVRKLTTAAGLMMSSTNANAFHRLWRMIGARMFFERMYTTQQGHTLVHC